MGVRPLAIDLYFYLWRMVESGDYGDEGRQGQVGAGLSQAEEAGVSATWPRREPV